MKRTNAILMQLRPAVAMLLGMTLLLGVVYPLMVTAIARLTFPARANGSLVTRDDRILGSSLIGQSNSDARYFWPRPSATDYKTLPSGASNEGPTSLALAELVRRREAEFRNANHVPTNVPIPTEMLFASASGLDPHISPEAARLQIPRVAQSRGLPEREVAAMVDRLVEPPQLAILGQSRVNVLLLNLALDELQ